MENNRLYESLTNAMERGNFAEGLDIVEQLMVTEPVSEEMVEIYCLCLVELGEFEEVIDFSLELDEMFPTLYTIALPYSLQSYYELGKYRQVIDIYDQVSEAERTEEMSLYYTLAHDMNMEQIEHSLKKYHRAIMAGNHQMAYRSMCSLMDAVVYPLRSMIEQLAQAHVHPIIKTEITLFCREANYQESILIEKFNLQQLFAPDELFVIEAHPVYCAIIDAFMKWEQQDPVVSDLAQRLLYHYFSVMYPFVIPKEHIPAFIAAIKHIVHASFDINDVVNEADNEAISSNQILEYQKQIQFCSDMYVSIYEIE